MFFRKRTLPDNIKQKALDRAIEIGAKRIFFYFFPQMETAETRFVYTFRYGVYGAKEPFLILKVDNVRSSKLSPKRKDS